MSRIAFYEPSEGIRRLSDWELHCVLLLVGHEIEPARIAPWTELERLLAYDYAMREHLHASDNPGIKRRPCPNFILEVAA